MSTGAAAPTPSFILASRSNPQLNAQHILHGYLQFNAGQYDEAMMYFQLTEAEPLQILSLFPDVLPSGLVQQQQQAQAALAAGGEVDDHASGLDASSPFAALPPLASQKHPVPVQKVQGEERLFRALSALIPYLAQIQNRLRLSLEPLFAAASGGKGPLGQPQEQDVGTRRRAQQAAAANPTAKQQAGSLPTKTDPNLALAILVDTVLLKAYLLCDIPLLPFLSSPYNLCDVDECANILRAYEKYHELIAFYKFRARHGQALELLANLGQISQPKNKSLNPASSQSLQPASNSSIASLSGTEPTIQYLQELAINIHQPCYPMTIPGFDPPPISTMTSALPAQLAQFAPTLTLEPNPEMIIALILHFSKWVTQTDPDDGLRIFTFCHTMNMRPVEPNKRSKDIPQSPGQSTTNIIHSYAHHKEHCIPSHIVLDHLKVIADREACIAYLESLINHVGETDELFHNELVFLYLDSIQKLLRAKEQREQALKQNGHGNGAVSTEPERLDSVSEIAVRRSSAARRTGSITAGGEISPPSASSSTSPSTAAPTATRDASRLHILRRKLLDFLRQSVHYTAEKMLSRFPRHQLLEERAILLSRINQHTQALTIYAHHLHDPLQAEAYAEEYYQQAIQAQNQSNGTAATDPNSPITSGALIAQGRDMYLNLLQVYLKPPMPDSERTSSVLQASGQSSAHSSAPMEQPAPMLDAALLLLSKYYDRISPVRALESLPPETPLQALWPYFEKLLCHTNHTYRDEQITKQLLKSEYYAMKEEYLLASRGRVVCDQNTNCSKCNKKLGNSAFARYPNGLIAHYNCHQQLLMMQDRQQPMKGDL